MREKMEEFKDDVVLTPWGCLNAVLEDYGFDTDHILGKVGTHIVEDFIDLMIKNGYIVKNGNVKRK